VRSGWRGLLATLPDRSVAWQELRSRGTSIVVMEFDSVSHARVITTDAIELWLASRAERTKRRAAR